MSQKIGIIFTFPKCGYSSDCPHSLILSHLYFHDRRLHWLPLSVRIQVKIIFLVYKAFLGLPPSYLCKLIILHINPRQNPPWTKSPRTKAPRTKAPRTKSPPIFGRTKSPPDINPPETKCYKSLSVTKEHLNKYYIQQRRNVYPVLL